MKRKYGAIQSPTDLRDYKSKVSRFSRVELPKEYQLNSTKIKDQGNVNSCVAYSLSSLLESKWHQNYSTGWIYGYRPEGYYQGEGMIIREALKTLQKEGAVKNIDFDYNIEMQEAKKLVDRNLTLLDALAMDHRITAYARLYSNYDIKDWLFLHGTPIPFSIATDDLILDKHNIIQIPNNFPDSGHAMLIIGWNECGFIVQNSWGEEWGLNGLAILPYDYPIREAWGITTTHTQAEEDVKKPKFYWLRKLLMHIYQLFIILIEGGK